MSSSSETINVYEAGGSGTGTIDMGDMSWSLGLGAEYHLSGTDKLSPFFSAGVSFGGMTMTEDWSNSDGVDYMADMTAAVESSGSTFGLGIGAGVDYYVFDNIYIGLEMGLGWESYTDGGGSTSITIQVEQPQMLPLSLQVQIVHYHLVVETWALELVGDSNKQQLSSFIKRASALFFCTIY